MRNTVAYNNQQYGKMKMAKITARKIIFVDVSKMSFKEACYVCGERGKKLYRDHVITNWLIVLVLAVGVMATIVMYAVYN